MWEERSPHGNLAAQACRQRAIVCLRQVKLSFGSASTAVSRCRAARRRPPGSAGTQQRRTKRKPARQASSDASAVSGVTHHRTSGLKVRGGRRKTCKLSGSQGRKVEPANARVRIGERGSVSAPVKRSNGVSSHCRSCVVGADAGQVKVDDTLREGPFGQAPTWNRQQ